MRRTIKKLENIKNRVIMRIKFNTLDQSHTFPSSYDGFYASQWSKLYFYH